MQLPPVIRNAVAKDLELLLEMNVNVWARFAAFRYGRNESLVFSNNGNPQQGKFTSHIFG
jgi:hypothetical protein